MSAVADSVGGGSSYGAVAQAGAAAKVGVCRVDARVDDVGICARAGSAVVDVARRASSGLVGNGTQSPRGCARLSGEGVEAPDLVSLDGSDLRKCQTSFLPRPLLRLARVKSTLTASLALISSMVASSKAPE